MILFCFSIWGLGIEEQNATCWIPLHLFVLIFLSIIIIIIRFFEVQLCWVLLIIAITI